MATQLAMLNLQRIPVIRVLIPFATGIVMGYLFEFPGNHLFWGFLILLSWFSLLILHLCSSRRSAVIAHIFGLWAFLLCLAVGITAGDASKPRDPRLPLDEWIVIRGIVKTEPKVTNSRLRCDVSLRVLFTSGRAYSCHTGIQVYFQPGTDSLLPKPGDSWQWLGKLVPIEHSGNPGSPDFESIMQKKNYWYRFFASDLELPSHPLRISEGSFRRNQAAFVGDAYFRGWKHGEEELALLKAVCLGDRTALTGEMKQSFGAAGGMHLLAVSGLHVGLIWWVLQLATGWMVKASGTGVFRSLLVLALLWLYASVTGFSSSVCRSVTMFSFFTSGRILGQRTQMLNGIGVSAFILLVIQPARLMELGFQLSYAAIVGILVFFPIIRDFFKIKNPFFKWLWNAAALSLSAQLLSAPLVIYYFHQLPIYSIATSILAIPVLSVLIALFTISIPFMALGFLENVFHKVLGVLAKLMNLTMETVAGIPGALLEDLHLSKLLLFLWMVFLTFVMIYLRNRSRSFAGLTLIVLSMIFLSTGISETKLRAGSEVIFCNFRSASLLILREGRLLDMYAWCGDSISQTYLRKYSKEAWDHRKFTVQYHEVVPGASFDGLNSACMELGSGIWAAGNENVAICILRDSGSDPHLARIWLDADTLSSFRPDYILLSGEPAKYLSGTFARHACGQLIMDGSNRRWFRDGMHSVRTGIHDTERHGVYRKIW